MPLIPKVTSQSPPIPLGGVQDVTNNNPACSSSAGTSPYCALSEFAHVAASGNYVYLVYESGLTEMFQRSTNRGINFTSPINLNQGMGGGIPQIAAYGSNVYVTWVYSSPLNPQEGVYVDTSNNYGASFNGPIKLVSSGAEVGVYISKIIATSCCVDVVWVDAIQIDGSIALCCITGTIWFADSIDNGTSFETPQNLSGTSIDMGGGWGLSLAAYAHYVYVAWISHDNDLLFRASENAGASFSEAVNLSNTLGDSFGMWLYDNSPSIVANSSNVFVAWQEGNPSPQVFFRRSNDYGGNFSPVTGQNATNLSRDRGPAQFPVLAMSGSNLYAVWFDGTPGVFDIALSRSLDKGVTFSTPIDLSYQLRQLTDYDPALYPTVAADGSNVYVLFNVGGNLALTSSSDNATTFSDLSFVSEGASYPALMPSMAASQGNVFITWQGARNGQQYGFAGSTASPYGGIFPNPTGGMSDIFFISSAAQQGDLDLTEVTPVQTIFNPTSLVAGKLTLLRAAISSTFPLDVYTRVKVQFNTLANGACNYVTVTETITVHPGTNYYYLPQNNFIKPCGQELTAAIVTLNPDNNPMETDCPNNPCEDLNDVKVALPVPIVATKPFRILYVPVYDAVTGNSPVCGAVQQFAQASTEFVEAVFPLNEEATSFKASCVNYYPGLQLFASKTPMNVQQVITFFQSLATMGRGQGYDETVGIVTPSWFKDMTVNYTNAAGLACCGAPQGNIPSVLVSELEMDGSVTAQEIAHTYGWVSTAVTAPPRCSGPHMCNVSAPGYWVARRQPAYDSAIDFMNPYVAPRTWVTDSTFEYLLGKLKDPAGDPVSIDVSAIIFKNDTASLEPWYTYTGLPDVPLGNPGNYTLLYLDIAGNQIAETGFDVYFTPLSHGDMSLPDFAGLSLGIPQVPGTAKILIKHGSAVLAERDVPSTPPSVSLTFPEGGELFNPGETMNVLWTASSPTAAPLNYEVSLSTDNGTSWMPLAIDLTTTSYSFQIPTNLFTNLALIKVTATDGVNTASAISTSTFSVKLSAGFIISNVTNLSNDSTALCPFGTSCSGYAGLGTDETPMVVASANNVYALWADCNPKIPTGYPGCASYPSPDDLFIRLSHDGGATFGTKIDLSNNPSANDYALDPQIAASGSNVYVLWQHEYYNYPTVTYQVLYRKSNDNGTTWGPITYISSNYTYSDGLAIAASGSEAYLAWQDVTTPPGSTYGQGSIYFTRSVDNGTTFSTSIRLTSATNGAKNPWLSASGSNVYVAWDDNRTGSWNVFFTRSTDSGGTFNTALDITNGIGQYTGIDSRMLVASGSDIYVAWNTASNGYWLRRSTDSGATFYPGVSLAVQTSKFAYYTANLVGIAASGSNLYLAFQASNSSSPKYYLLLTQASSDNGATFNHPVLVWNATSVWVGVAVGVTELQMGAYGSTLYLGWAGAPISSGSCGGSYAFYCIRQPYFSYSIDNGASFTTPTNESMPGSAYSPLSVYPRFVAINGKIYQIEMGVSSSYSNGDAFGDVYFNSATQYTATNPPPVAVADKQITVTSGSLVGLNGAASYDQQGLLLSYNWTQTGGSALLLAGQNDSIASFTAPLVQSPTIFRFELTVNDSMLTSAPINITVTVAPASPLTSLATNYPSVARLFNVAPTVYVQNQTVNTGVRVTLTSLTFDLNNDYLSFQWSQVAGPSATLISRSNSNNLTFTAPTVAAKTVLTFKLTVGDDYANTSAIVDVTVLPVPLTATVPESPVNLQVTANANHITLTWQPPSSNGGANITGYTIYRGTSPGGEGGNSYATIGNVTTYADTSVTPGTTYYYIVKANNSVGSSTASNEAYARVASSSPPQESSSIPLGEPAGIGLGVFAVLAIFLFLLLRRRKRGKSDEVSSVPGDGTPGLDEA